MDEYDDLTDMGLYEQNKKIIVAHLRKKRGIMFAEPTDDDIYVEGYLSELMGFIQDWRSEIEEL